MCVRVLSARCAPVVYIHPLLSFGVCPTGFVQESMRELHLESCVNSTLATQASRAAIFGQSEADKVCLAFGRGCSCGVVTGYCVPGCLVEGTGAFTLFRCGVVAHV